jgi:hypothetical protein
MTKGTSLYVLWKKADYLCQYLNEADKPEDVKRDAVMHLVHEINEAYVEWGFELDVEHLRAPRQEQLDLEVSQR